MRVLIPLGDDCRAFLGLAWQDLDPLRHLIQVRPTPSPWARGRGLDFRATERATSGIRKPPTRPQWTQAHPGRAPDDPRAGPAESVQNRSTAVVELKGLPVSCERGTRPSRKGCPGPRRRIVRGWRADDPRL